MPKIVLIEEQHLFRDSLIALINTFDNCEVVSSSGSIKTIQNDINVNEIDLVILSIEELRENASKKGEKLTDIFPFAKIMVLLDDLNRSDFSFLSEQNVFSAFSKNAGPGEFEKILSSCTKYEVHTEIKLDSISQKNLLSSRLSNPQETIKFTRRELEILNLVCMEKTNAEISDILGLSIRTIESFRRRMIYKVNCKNMIGVILKVIQSHPNGLKIISA